MLHPGCLAKQKIYFKNTKMLFIVYGMYISMCVYDTVTSSCELTLFWGVVRLQGVGLYKYHE